MTFGFIKFCYETEEVHSKHGGLEIIHLHLKSCFILCFLLNPLAILQICAISRKKRHNYKKLQCHLKMLRAVKSVHVPNFVSISSL